MRKGNKTHLFLTALFVVLSSFVLFAPKVLAQSSLTSEIELLNQRYDRGEITEQQYNELAEQARRLWQDIDRKNAIKQQLNNPDSGLSPEERGNLERELGVLEGKNEGENAALDTAIEGAVAETASTKECGWFSDWSCFFELGISRVGQLLIHLGTWLVWLAAKIFEISLEYGVKDLTSLINDGGVTDAWAILRNFANLFFIFVLLYVAIAFILDLKVAQKEKIITTVIISALLINFSAFFAKAVIDVSNVTANQFYAAISQRSAGKAHTVTTPEGEKKTSSISGVFLNSLSLEDHYKNPTGSPLKVLVRVFGSTVLLLIVSFVLLAGAVLLIIRAVSLIFLVIVAPLAFLAWAVPSFGDYFIKWWKTLFNQAFFAPLYLLFFFASVKVLESGAMNKLATRADTGIVGGNIALIFHFAIIIGLMLGSLILAVKLGALGSNTVMAYGKKWSRAIPGSFARRTVGKAAYLFRDSKMLKRITAWAPGIGGGLRSIADTGAGAKFGTQKSYKQKIDDATKVGQNEFKGQPELQAKYYKNLGRGALARAFGFGDKLAQRKAFEGLKDEDKVKMEAGLRKPYEELSKQKLKTDLEQEKRDYMQGQNTLELDWYNTIYPTLTLEDRAKANIDKRAKEAKAIKEKVEEFERKIAAAPENDAELAALQAAAHQKQEKLGGFVSGISQGMSPDKRKKFDEARRREANKEINKKRKEKELETIYDEMAETEKELANEQKELDRLKASGWTIVPGEGPDGRIKTLKQNLRNMIDRSSRLENSLGWNRDESPKAGGGGGGGESGGEGKK